MIMSMDLSWSLVMAALLLGLFLHRPSMAEQLEVGFYADSCPNAEFIVRAVVERASSFDRTIPAALLRLHNHDCFVQGCDGSVLITKTGGGPPENQSPNHAGLRGFEVIDQAKAQLEAECPGVVSCADIVAVAARDAISLSQGPFYRVPTGRRDGLVSRASDADDLPEVHDSVEVLKNKFAEKGLSVNDLVVLTAAHTIGTTACFFVTDRLYRFPNGGGGGGVDPLINRSFLPELMAQCPMGGDVNVRLPLDWGSEFVFDEHVLANIRAGLGVIGTDAELYADPSTRGIVDEYLNFFSFAVFARDFADAMVRMGEIGVKTGADGEVRRVCSEFN